MYHKIHPIALCQGERDMSYYTYRWNIGVKVKSANYIWYIEGSDPITIVDAGANEEHYNKAVPMSDITTVEQGLQAYGLQPQDVRQIIMTHLHFDHMAWASKYKNAVFIVQKKELDYAKNPHIFSTQDYYGPYLENITFQVIEGDTEILPGIKVLLTPGHSPGGQSVQISTEKGKAIITGFCSQMSTFTQTPFMKEKGYAVAAFGLHTDALQAYDSALKVKNTADIIIPLHDPMFIDLKTIP